MTDRPSEPIQEKGAAENGGGPNDDRHRGAFVLTDGRIYFSRQTERKIFFVLTVLMLVYGICSRMGLL